MVSKILWLLFITFNMNCLFANSTTENLAAMTAVSAGLNQFSVEFYQKAIEGKEDKNLICSPLSAGLVLAMTTYGAKGRTEEQMRKTLRMPEDTLSKNGYQSFINVLNSAKEIDLRLANKIFAPDNFEPKPEFKEVTSKYFTSPIENIDFSKPVDAVQKINNWCAANTNNKIKKILEPSDLHDALMVLLNAVYFKGNWMSKFDTELSKPVPFHINGNEATQDVQMMYKRGKFNFGVRPDLKAKYIELPYMKKDDNDETSMFIIVPDELNGLKEVEDNLNKLNFGEMHNSANIQEVNLQLPKFKIESEIDLKPVLKKMGMTDMFEDIANFTGITDTPPLKIGKAVQKAFIEVNEEGSEAAAVTAVVALMRSGRVHPEIILNIDRPFLYSIVHIKTNAVLFQGHITQPAY